MDEKNWEQEVRDAQRRADEARRAWRQAREEMRHAFKRAKEESKRAKSRGAPYEEGLDEALRDVVEAAAAFGREMAEEARSFADDVVKTAREDWQPRWREQWEKTFGKEGQAHWVFGGRRFRQWTSGAGEEANPFVAAILSRGAGLLAVYVLHLLAEQPRHGNDIMRQIEQRTMGSWTSNPGAIYPLLSFMEEKGLVRSQWEDPDKRTRRIYHIADEGRQELERLRGVLRPKVMEAIEVLHILYDDLYEKGEQAPTGTTEGSAGGSERPTAEQSGPPRGESEAESTFVGAEEAGWRARLGRFLNRGPRQVALSFAHGFQR